MYASVEDTFQLIKDLPQNGDLYEFGVYKGNTLTRLISGFAQNKNELRKIWAFDSFQGLPKEAEGVQFHPDWQPGVFDARAADALNVNTVEECVEKLNLHFKNITNKEVTVIPGWFENVLTDNLLQKHDFAPASYVHIDTDLFVSALQAMNFMCKNKLLKKGTLIRYDDWCSTPEWTAGQSLAHKTITQKYGLECNRLTTNVFVVK